MTTEQTTPATVEVTPITAVPARQDGTLAMYPAKKATKKTTKKATPAKKATKKAESKKTPTKKAPKSAPAAKAEKNGKIKISDLQTKVLSLLAKGTPLTRTQLSQKLDNAWVGSDLMGHLDPAKVKPSSLLARGYVKMAQHDVNGKDVITYTITAAGKKVIGK